MDEVTTGKPLADVAGGLLYGHLDGAAHACRYRGRAGADRPLLAAERPAPIG